MHPTRRKTLLINPTFQRSFLTYTLGAAGALIGVFYGAVSYFFWNLDKLGREVGLAPDHVFFRFVADQKTAMNAIFAVTAVITAGVLLSYGMYLSHRIAGPLYRLQKYMGEWAAGQARGPLKFRDKDYFPELADSINVALTTASATADTSRDRRAA